MNKALWQPILGLVALLLCAALILGGWFWYDASVDRSGWVERNGVTYYKDAKGHPVTGWQQIQGDTYFFLEDNTRQKGFLQTQGGTYYFGETGVMQTGFLEIQGEHYQFDEQGRMVTGWYGKGQQRRCFGPDGRMITGWLEDQGSRYYLFSDGTLCRGYLEQEEGTYFFDDSGKMHTGWLETDQGRSYFDADGTRHNGWLELEGKTYLLSDEGIAQTGWLEEGEYLRYFLADGAMAVNPTEIEGRVYYFTPKGYQVTLVNYNHPIQDPIDPELIYITRYFAVDASIYDELMEMLEDCRAAGNVYYYNSGFRTHQEQWGILQARTNEYMATGLSYQQALTKALTSVAYPGTSEHELGLAVDIEGGSALAWLSQHCWEYGFILRYPPEKTQITKIIYEPWHFRYVGVEISMDMKDTGLCLEEYLQADKAVASDEEAQAA